jgi:Xaa-Pro aminopeptidase
MKSRVERLRRKLDEQGLDALLVTEPYNRRYLSGFTGSNGMLLIAQETAQIATDFRYFEQARQEAPDFELFEADRDFGAWFKRLVAPFGGKRLGFEAAHVSVDLHRQMREFITELPAGQRPEFVPTVGVVESLRMIKEPEEIAALERVVALGDAAFAHVAQRIEPGWTEKQVAWEIEKYIREHGGEGLSFSTIVAGGPHGALPHARPRDVPLRKGEGVVIDMGALLDGYCSDMTRTIFLGEPDEQFKKIYDIVLTAQLTAEELIEAGMRGDQAHAIAHKVIEEAGYGPYFGHGLGHGIGLQVHELPWLRPTSTSVLENGMVFSVEPGIYITGWGGVRIEDLVVLENGRCRVLTKSPKVRPAGAMA